MEFRRRALAIRPRQAQADQSWVDIDGVPVQGGRNENPSCWREVISPGVVPDLHTLQLRDPQTFSVGGVHCSAPVWEELLQGHPQGERIGEWIRRRVDILEFSRPFSGSFKGSRYTADLPPRRVFPNHPSCKSFSAFISSEILSRLTTGAFRV